MVCDLNGKLLCLSLFGPTCPHVSFQPDKVELFDGLKEHALANIGEFPSYPESVVVQVWGNILTASLPEWKVEWRSHWLGEHFLANLADFWLVGWWLLPEEKVEWRSGSGGTQAIKLNLIKLN